MADSMRSARTYWWSVAIATTASVVGYYVYASVQPTCGAPGNTPLGRSNRWVPWAILGLLLTVVALLGVVHGRRTATIVQGLVASGLLAVLAGVGVAFYVFAAGHCYY